MLTAPLKTPLTHIDDDLTHEALDAFVMVCYSFFLPVSFILHAIKHKGWSGSEKNPINFLHREIDSQTYYDELLSEDICLCCSHKSV